MAPAGQAGGATAVLGAGLTGGGGGAEESKALAEGTDAFILF